MVQMQRDVDTQNHGLQRHVVPVTTSMHKGEHLLNLPGEGSSPQREDILRWTTHDAAQAQFHSLNFEEASSSDAIGTSTDCHRRILENICTLAMDPIHEVYLL